eukprot:Lithocolla_globosa_v1_NODE_1039_length_2923_cov_6.165969.p2 type:complete len:162 gc:universal NODE_1039_length_2923_cov_6.165969:930-445(-)
MKSLRYEENKQIPETYRGYGIGGVIPDNLRSKRWPHDKLMTIEYAKSIPSARRTQDKFWHHLFETNEDFKKKVEGVDGPPMTIQEGLEEMARVKNPEQQEQQQQQQQQQHISQLEKKIKQQKNEITDLKLELEELKEKKSVLRKSPRLTEPEAKRQKKKRG